MTAHTKGKVEAGVKYTRRNFLAAGDFETIEAANADLPDWLTNTAGMRTHGTTGRRPLEVFAAERGALLGLPTTPYEPVVWKQATVHRDSHVEFERRLYSVPWPHTGAQVWIKATPTSVLIYAEDQRIATHERRGTRRHSTHKSHLPAHRADLAQRSMEYWLDRAGRLGPAVRTYVRHVIASDRVLSKLRDVQGIVTYLERFPQRRALAACQRADYFGNYTYRDLRRILDHALDLEPLPSSGPAYGHLTQPRFARPAAELLAPTKEVTIEPRR